MSNLFRVMAASLRQVSLQPLALGWSVLLLLRNGAKLEGQFLFNAAQTTFFHMAFYNIYLE